MLFTTSAFVFLFMPVVFVGFFVAARFSRAVAAVWLCLASLYFYGYWAPKFVPLLLSSIAVNFVVGSRISRASLSPKRELSRSVARRWLIAGVIFNLALLGYFKYHNFFVENANTILGTHFGLSQVVLPIGISFYTFTQIAFLADAYQRGTSEYKLSHYGLFVTYFPHLIAGPVLHHAQIMPQFGSAETYRLQLDAVAGGLVIFTIGLIKKVVFADVVSPYADAVFHAADAGQGVIASEAWLGAFAYTFQLYFDFSGYCDMAVGVSRLFNVQLPYNFDSPYKAASITDFWRRWHMTLSAFLRDYLYIPLGGNRAGSIRRYINLMITMLLGGLWHGASWTFVFWGGLHGIYLMVNHGYRAMATKYIPTLSASKAHRVISIGVTFFAVLAAWVFFRAHTFSGASIILHSIVDVSSFSWPDAPHPALWNAGLSPGRGWAWCMALGLVAFFGPNSNRIGERTLLACRSSPAVRYFLLGASLISCIFLVIVNESRDVVSPFIYYNF